MIETWYRHVLLDTIPFPQSTGCTGWRTSTSATLEMMGLVPRVRERTHTIQSAIALGHVSQTS